MSLVKSNNVVFPSFLNEIMKPDWFGGSEMYRRPVPAVNIKESETHFELTFAIPGFKKEDFNVEVDNETLIVSAEIKETSENQNEHFTRKEYSVQSFKRLFTLPETINEEVINASYENGILRLTLPKKEEALPKPKRLIEIS